MFPERKKIVESMDLCESIGGTLAVTKSKEDFIKVGDIETVSKSFSLFLVAT